VYGDAFVSGNVRLSGAVQVHEHVQLPAASS
jgi:hypothetical protein